MIRGISLSTATRDATHVLAAGREAEEARFDGVWCYDHLSGSLFGGNGSLDVWSMLAALAVATENVTIGSLVANVTTRQPVHIALAAATLQSLSGGRLRLGLGAGASRPSPYAAELEMFELPQESAQCRRNRLVEAIAFLRALWDGSGSFHGEYARFEGISGVSIPDPPCPIIVGSNGPRMAAVAGTYADGVNFHSWEPDLAGLIQTAQETAAATGNAPFTVSVEGPLQPDWLDLDSPTLAYLRGLGVTEVMLRWSPDMGLDAIRAAARWLS